MLISELMERAGVTRDTLRHYEDIGLLHEAHFCKRDNGYREYNESAIDRIRFIKQGQKAGFKLRQILKVADDWESNELPTEEKIHILTKQLAVIDARIADLQALKAEIHAILDLEGLVITETEKAS